MAVEGYVLGLPGSRLAIQFSNKLNRLGLAIVIIGIGFTFIAFAGFGLGGGEDKIEGHTYCDVSGTLSGLVRDYNSPIPGTAIKDVINWDMNLAVKAGTCEIYDGGILASTVGSQSGHSNILALIGTGSVQITISVYNPADEIVGSHVFTVSTGFNVPEQAFTEQFLIKGLEKGVQYDFRVTHVWNPNQTSFEEAFTV